jgi:hypothetical protein
MIASSSYNRAYLATVLRTFAQIPHLLADARWLGTSDTLSRYMKRRFREKCI